MGFTQAKCYRADLIAHSPLADHAARQFGGLFEIVGGPGGYILEHNFFSGPAAQHDGKAVEQIAALYVMALFFGDLFGRSQRLAPGNYGDLLQGIGSR